MASIDTAARPPRRSDGEQTHAAILDAAMRIASVEGLAGLTIGRLATELGISKSGVYAHFGSKERLQHETVRAAAEVYRREVIEPGLAAAEGVGQLEGICEAFLSYVERGVFPGGCFFAHVIAEVDAQAGPIRDAVAAGQHQALALLEDRARVARELGQLDASTDDRQLAFELTAAIEQANYLSMLHRDPTYLTLGRQAVARLLSAAQRR